MASKRAADIKIGDKIVFDGETRTVTFSRKHRRYRGYMVIQHDGAPFTRYYAAQIDIKCREDIEIAN